MIQRQSSEEGQSHRNPPVEAKTQKGAQKGWVHMRGSGQCTLVYKCPYWGPARSSGLPNVTCTLTAFLIIQPKTPSSVFLPQPQDAGGSLRLYVLISLCIIGILNGPLFMSEKINTQPHINWYVPTTAKYIFCKAINNLRSSTASRSPANTAVGGNAVLVLK